MARTLAIGDIHGCLTALDTLLGFVQPTADDRLIFLGDYVDRGPDSKGVLDRLIELKRSREIVCLRGNHEVMMLRARHGPDEFRLWMSVGGNETLDSYATPGAELSIAMIPANHWTLIEQHCRDWLETATHIFVHADLHPELPIAEQPSEWIHWQAINASWQRVSWHKPHVSGKTMICGHTQQRSGFPLVLERAVCIDTWAYGDGWLTCLDVESGEYWQANELGQTREG
jgi:serine/threonine protein phosphatase 1